jgi:hypothetical protein
MADDSTELRLAKMYREEGDKLREQANADLEAARYERGQADHAKRTAEDHHRAAAECKRWLEQHDEAKVRAIVAAADEKLKQAQELMAQYNADRHGAMISLQSIDARERAEREQPAA